MSTYGFPCCSNGSSMFSPTDVEPPSLAPRFAASMIPGPPPVMIAMPSSLSSRATARASSYCGSPSGTRADPKIETAQPRSSKSAKPRSNSRPIRCRRSTSLWSLRTPGALAWMISSSGVLGCSAMLKALRADYVPRDMNFTRRFSPRPSKYVHSSRPSSVCGSSPYVHSR